jgi:putative ABC transport system permease protein
MQLRPILSAMRRNKVGAILITLQMAITLAILCNGLFIIQQRLALSQRPSGLEEKQLFVMSNLWVGNPPDLAARQEADMAALRSLPGVVDAFTTNSYPLSDGGQTEGCSLKPEQQHSTARCAIYVADTHGLETMGLKLIAGRNFTPDEVLPKGGYIDLAPPSAVIITRALAEKLFPGRSALGESLYAEFQKHRTPIIGVVDRLQVPWTRAGGWGSTFFDYSIIEPFHFATQYSHYLVRAKPGQLATVVQAAQKKLFEVNRGRVLEHVRTLSETRTEAYRDDRGLAVILAVVCTALLAVTSFGIVGLTSYWVTQRRRQIGIRRALGATRTAIIRYFQTENLFIAATAAALGCLLAVAVNMWMVTSFEMERLQSSYAIVGALVVLVLGQLAVLWPALRAASIPPALATRSV